MNESVSKIVDEAIGRFALKAQGIDYAQQALLNEPSPIYTPEQLSQDLLSDFGELVAKSHDTPLLGSDALGDGFYAGQITAMHPGNPYHDSTYCYL